MNEYDLILQQDEQTQALRSKMVGAVRANPDQYGEAKRLEGTTGVPAPVAARNLDTVRERAKLNEYDALVKQAPATFKALLYSDAAYTGHDDTENMTAIESALRPVTRAVRSTLSGAPSLAAGGYGIGEAFFGLAESGFGELARRTVTDTNPITPVREFFTQRRAGQQNLAKIVQGDVSDAGFVERAVYSGFQSLGQNLPPLVAAFYTGNPQLALSVMASSVAGTEYSKAREKGADAPTAVTFAATQALIEYATEKLPVAQLLGDVEKRTGFFKTLTKNIALEVPGEQVATVLQDLNEWAVLNPDKPFSAYLAERPSAAAQTLIATVVASGGQVATLEAVARAGERLQLREQQQQQAEQRAGLLQQLGELAGKSKLRERDPTSFSEFVQNAAENGGEVTDVYLSANALTQAGIDPAQLAAVSPVVAEQMGELQAGADIRIPVGEFAARIAPTDLAQPLLEHLRTSPEGMSAAEAKTFAQSQVEQMQKDAQSIYSERANDEQWQASVKQVETEIADQLGKANRFTPDVNSAYAALVRDFYSTTAAKLGITPTEMLQRYPLRVQAEQVTGERTLDQPGTPAFERWFGDSKVVDGQGKPLRVFHGTAADFSEFRRTRSGEFGPAIYFTDSPREAGEYGAGQQKPGVNIMPVYLSIKNPYTKGVDAFWKEFGRDDDGDAEAVARAKAAGYDGVIAQRKDEYYDSGRREFIDTGRMLTHYIAFDPEQIKSVFNRGTFDPNDANILNQDAQLPTFEQYADAVEARNVQARERNIATQERYARGEFTDDERATWSRAMMESAQRGAPAEIEQLRAAAPSMTRETLRQLYDDFAEADPDKIRRTVESVKGGVLAQDAPPIAVVTSLAQAVALQNLQPIEGEVTPEKVLGPELMAEAKAAIEQFKSGTRDLTEDERAAAAVALKPLIEAADRNKPAFDAALTEIAAELGARAVLPPNKSLKRASEKLVIEAKGDITEMKDVLRATIEVAHLEDAQAVLDALGARFTFDRVKNRTTLPMRAEARTFKDNGPLRSGYSDVLTNVELADGTIAEVQISTPYMLAAKEPIGHALYEITRAMAEDAPAYAELTQLQSRIYSRASTLERLGSSTIAAKSDSGTLDPQAQAFAAGNFQDSAPRNATASRLSGDNATGMPSTSFSDQPAAASSFQPTIAPPSAPLLANADSFVKPLNQGQRGQINFAPDITQQPTVITLLANADLSTFLHESGHFFLEVYADIAGRPDAPPAIVEDMNRLLKWFGITGAEAAAGGQQGGALAQGLDAKKRRAGAFDNWTFSAAGQQVGEATTSSDGTTMTIEGVLVPESARGAGVGRQIIATLVRDAQRRGLAYIEGEVIGRRMAQLLRTQLGDPEMVDNGIRELTFAEALEQLPENGADNLSGGKVFMRFPVPEAAYAQGGQPQAPGTPPIQPQRTPLETWRAMSLEQKRPYHEQLARGFEAYLFEGKAPSTGLANLFARFRAWMVAVYRQLTNLNVSLTDEVRGVFDRMLATNDEIIAAEQRRGMAPLFKSAAEAGMSPDEWARYQSVGQQATQRAVDELQARSLRDMRWTGNAKARELKRLQDEAREKRRLVRTEVEAEVSAMPVNRARLYLAMGELDGAPVENPQKLSSEALVELYGGEGDRYALLDWSPLARGGKRAMASAEGTLTPDAAAELFGFTSGDHLVRELLTAEPMAQTVDGMTDQRMLERYGDLVDADSIERAAEAAIHNEVRGRFVATELAALQNANTVREDTGRTVTDSRGRTRRVTVDALAKAAREFAERTIGGKRLRDIRPAQYAGGEARAARAAETALAKGDLVLAATEKRNQLVNHYTERAATDALAEADRARNYLAKFDGDGARKSIDADYLDQIHRLLERFDLRRGLTLREIDRRKTLVQWVESQREMGLEPDIPAELLDEAQRKAFRDLTLEEMRGLVDTVKQIEHLGRLKTKLLTAKDAREFADARDRLVQSIVDNANRTYDDLRTRNTIAARFAKAGRQFLAMHRKMASLAYEMDGGQDGGPVWEFFIRTMNEAGDREATMREQATLRMSELAQSLRGLTMGGKGNYFPTLRTSLNREERIGIALNLGNEGNLQRLLDGEGWTRADIQPVLDSLSKAEWDFVQGVWDFFESYRPQIAEKERRLYGKEPEWVAAAPIDTPHGRYRGGYYPIKYDPARSSRAEQHADAEEARQQMRAAYTSATTRRSFTKARSEEVKGRPLLYSLDGLFQGTEEVIHDLSWHEWLIDVNRLLRDKAVDAAMRQHYGAEGVQVFKTAIQDIARGEQPATNVFERGINHLRTGATMAGMGYSVMTAALQPLGLTQSMVRIGTGYVAKGIGQWMKAPLQSVEFIHARSEMMRLRAKTMQREINEIRNRVSGERSAARIFIDGTAFYMMAKLQAIADVPTWLGQYEKSIAAGETEERAARLADQAVLDAQSGGQVKDLAAIQRGSPLMKLFTNFYSYFNAAYNIGAQRYRNTDLKSPAEVGLLAVDFLLLYSVPAVLGVLLKEALTGGDWDEEKLLRKMINEQISYLFGLVVGLRELSAAAQKAAGVQQFDGAYGGPAGLRAIQEIDKLSTQAAQGEIDRALTKAAINAAGVVFHLPSGQINRSIDGTMALIEGDTENPLAVLAGPPSK